MKVRAILKCGTCGAVIDETKFMDADELIKNHMMISLTSVFAGSCPKGCSPTFSDCNMRTTMTYKDDEGKRITFDKIKEAVSGTA